ncbi:MAG: hypothetical protein WD649_02325 [Thermoleophilaceae bacterium]
MKTRRLLVPLLLVGSLAVLALATPSSASAAKARLGIADNNLATLQDPRFRAFGIRYLRITIPWNVYLRPNGGTARRFSRTIRTAQGQGIRVLASFTLGAFKSKRRRLALVPLRSYTRMFKRFRRKHRSVREIIPWNEQNHRFMPTRTRRGSRRAALYYRAVKRNCRGCTVLGATVIDEKNVVSYLRRFKRQLRQLRIRQPRIWGLHAYKGVEARGGGNTRQVRRMLRTIRGKVWIVESGGLFKHSGRRPKVPPNAQRQARQDRFLFNRLGSGKRPFNRITRLYIYNWAQVSKNTWDSALIGPDYAPGGNTPTTPLLLRPAFFVVQSEAQKRRGFRGPVIPVPPGLVVP